MKIPALVSLAIALAIPSIAHAGDAALEAPIRQMEAAFNKGDVAAAKATHVASPTIIDEVAPYVWSGPGAIDRWLGDLGKDDAATGKTDGKVWIGTPVRESIVGTSGYVFAPCTYTFHEGGRTMRETGTITFALVKTDAGWKIAAWTWTSPEAVPVG
jgi:hypothetical protein